MDDKDREIDELKRRLEAVEQRPAGAMTHAQAKDHLGGCGVTLAVLLLAFIGIATCSSLTHEDDPKMSNGKDEIENRVAAEIAVERQLRDPKSAEYGTVLVRDLGGGDVVVCGQVNARNAFGGYVGQRPFLYEHGVATILDTSNARSFGKVFAARCG